MKAPGWCILGILVAAGACAGPPRGRASNPRPVALESVPIVKDAGADARAATWQDLLGDGEWVEVGGEPFASVGHAPGRWTVKLWANAIAARAFRSRARNMPEGSVLVEETVERDAEDEARGPVLAMTKGASGGWRWTVLGRQAEVVVDGALDRCVGCHADAPFDGVFPIPRPLATARD